MYSPTLAILALQGQPVRGLRQSGPANLGLRWLPDARSNAGLKNWSAAACRRSRQSTRGTGAASLAAGQADQFGTLREGLRADLVLVDGNAAQDVRCLANPLRSSAPATAGGRSDGR